MINISPLVSLCIPTYNSALFLSQSLDSIAAQTYKNIEVIISDNASTDETPDIIKSYCDRYDWTFHRNQINIGAGNNFNKLIDIANGKYIAIYHADDIYHPTIVEKSVQAFESSTDIGLVGTMGSVIDKNGNPLYDFEFPVTLRQNYRPLNFDDIFDGILSNCNNETLLITPSIMVKKECYDRLGNFEIHGKYKSAGDYEMWLRIAEHYKTVIINEKLIQYRFHAGQGSELEIRQNLEIPDILPVMEDYVQKTSDPQIHKKYLNWKDKLLLKTALKQNTVGLFQKSTSTLKKIKIVRFKLAGFFVHTANIFMISIPFDAFRKAFNLFKRLFYRITKLQGRAF